MFIPECLVSNCFCELSQCVYTGVLFSNCFYEVLQCVYTRVFSFELFLRRVSQHSHLSVEISSVSVTCYSVFIHELLQCLCLYLVRSLRGVMHLNFLTYLLHTY